MSATPHNLEVKFTLKDSFSEAWQKLVAPPSTFYIPQFPLVYTDNNDAYDIEFKINRYGYLTITWGSFTYNFRNDISGLSKLNLLDILENHLNYTDKYVQCKQCNREVAIYVKDKWILYPHKYDCIIKVSDLIVKLLEHIRGN